MSPVVIWATRVVALLIAAAAGWRLARVAPDWREDRFNELDQNSLVSTLEASDPYGMYAGCASVYISGWNEIYQALRTGRLLGYVLPILAVAVATVGWPPDPAIWREHLGFVEVVIAPWLWWPLLGSSVGYLAGRVLHRGYFRD